MVMGIFAWVSQQAELKEKAYMLLFYGGSSFWGNKSMGGRGGVRANKRVCY